MSKQNIVAHWSDEARKGLVGRKIVEVRYLSRREMVNLGFTKSALVLVLGDGTMLFPSRDDEGKDGGAMFGQGPEGELLLFPAINEHLMEREVPLPALSSEEEDIYEGPVECRHKNMLKRIRGGEELHGGCWKILKELRDLGFLSTMERKTIPYLQDRSRQARWVVELSEKGEAA